MIFWSLHTLFPEEPRTPHTQHRLCIYSQRESFVKSKSSGAQVRSLLFFGINDISSIKPYDISPICLGFRLLRVLDLGCINVGNSFPRDIELMVQLRYLALPSTIFKLSYLKTFLLKALRGEVCLPYTIWTLSRLRRHLHIDARAVFGWDGYDGWNLIRLENLQTISTPSLIYEIDRTMDPNEVMRRLPKIRKLRCISMDSDDCYHFPSLFFLSRLESVKILHYGDIPMLWSVELHWCSLSAVNSIVLIQEEVLEYTGDEGFKVHVYRPDLDSRSSPEDHSD
ncbi:hypothetical protein BC332_23238 [Capsicum chinense]|nr:hypothetical protein BC332_23238 [Capsicum chinense]